MNLCMWNFYDGSFFAQNVSWHMDVHGYWSIWKWDNVIISSNRFYPLIAFVEVVAFKSSLCWRFWLLKKVFLNWQLIWYSKTISVLIFYVVFYLSWLVICNFFIINLSGQLNVLPIWIWNDFLHLTPTGSESDGVGGPPMPPETAMRVHRSEHDAHHPAHATGGAAWLRPSAQGEDRLASPAELELPDRQGNQTCAVRPRLSGHVATSTYLDRQLSIFRDDHMALLQIQKSWRPVFQSQIFPQSCSLIIQNVGWKILGLCPKC